MAFDAPNHSLSWSLNVEIRNLFFLSTPSASPLVKCRQTVLLCHKTSGCTRLPPLPASDPGTPASLSRPLSFEWWKVTPSTITAGIL